METSFATLVGGIRAGSLGVIQFHPCRQGTSPFPKMKSNSKGTEWCRMGWELGAPWLLSWYQHDKTRGELNMLFLFPFQAMAEKQLLHSQSTRCGECGKAFSLSSNRDRHVQQSHRGLRSFRCGEEDCQKTFARKEGLTLHCCSAHRQGSSQESNSDSDTGNFKRSSRIVDGRIIIRKQRPEVREAGLQAQRTLPWNAMYIKQSASDTRPPMGDPVIDLTKETPSATPDSGVDSEEDPYRRRELKRRRAARQRRHRDREERERREKMARK